MDSMGVEQTTNKIYEEIIHFILKGELILLILVRTEFTVMSTAEDGTDRKASEILNVNDSASRVTKVRILCLHGYGQSANIFKAKLGGIRKKFRHRVEFSFVDGPYIVKECEENNEVERAWFLRTEDGTWDLKGLEESLRYLDEYYAENGPFDGLLGFSQGVDAAIIFCTSPAYNFKFVILIAGKKLTVPGSSVYYENEIKVPSLHVMGEADTIIVKERSEELRDCFCPNTTETIVHEGGHYVPSKEAIRRRYIAFIEKYAGN